MMLLAFMAKLRAMLSDVTIGTLAVVWDMQDMINT